MGPVVGLKKVILSTATSYELPLAYSCGVECGLASCRFGFQGAGLAFGRLFSAWPG